MADNNETDYDSKGTISGWPVGGGWWVVGDVYTVVAKAMV